MRANRTIGICDRDWTFKDQLKGLPDIKPLVLAADQHRHRLELARDLARRLGIHTGLTRARGSMFTHFTPADLVAILNIPRLQTLPNSFKILREYRLSVVALVFSR